MSEWEYLKIALNQATRKTDDVDLLCDAGEEGWELVVIMPNNVAYLKRTIGHHASEPGADSSDAMPPAHEASGKDEAPSAGTGYKAQVKYRDPKTGETWSGRGRMATWLKTKLDAGEDIKDYLV
jgi:H-NS histone family